VAMADESKSFADFVVGERRFGTGEQQPKAQPSP